MNDLTTPGTGLSGLALDDDERHGDLFRRNRRVPHPGGFSNRAR
jgi:hypothetical protein